ncbi:MAG: hypothetical protein VYA30_14080 [Myxococcota bacterium]|nr:hypothetical protein [Myxococcota bacterium]
MNQLEHDLAAALKDHDVVGEPLSDERFAEIVEGAEMTAAEAKYLLGCQESRELLVLLGQTLAELEPIERQPRPPSFTSPTPPKRPSVADDGLGRGRKRASVVSASVFLCAALAFAGVGYVGYQVLVKRDVEPTLKTKVRPETGQAVPTSGNSSRQTSPSKSNLIKEDESRVAEGQSIRPRTAQAGLRVESRTHRSDENRKPTDRQHTSGPKSKGLKRPSKMTRTMGSARTRSSVQSENKKPHSQPNRASKPKVKNTKSVFEARLGTQRLEQRRGPIEVTRQAVSGPSRGFGQLRLNSKPAAEVFIDGLRRGWTPIIDLRLQAGPHDVKLVYRSPLADKTEERFRVIIKADQTWGTVRDNRKKVDESVK